MLPLASKVIFPFMLISNYNGLILLPPVKDPNFLHLFLLLILRFAMGTNKRSELSSDRQKWDKIFNGLVRMLQTQQTQLETLVKERKLLEERVRVQHERWVSDIRLYKDHIAQVIYPILQRLFYFIFSIFYPLSSKLGV